MSPLNAEHWLSALPTMNRWTWEINVSIVTQTTLLVVLKRLLHILMYSRESHNMNTFYRAHWWIVPEPAVACSSWFHLRPYICASILDVHWYVPLLVICSCPTLLQDSSNIPPNNTAILIQCPKTLRYPNQHVKVWSNIVYVVSESYQALLSLSRWHLSVGVELDVVPFTYICIQDALCSQICLVPLGSFLFWIVQTTDHMVMDNITWAFAVLHSHWGK